MTLGLQEKADVVVIGGGIIGVSILYHLAKWGIENVVLIERKKLASGTTWHAAGIVGQLRESSAQTELAKYTARLFQELEEETGQATGYKQNGTINLALTDVRMEQLLRSHDHAERMEIESRLLGVDDLKQRFPHIDYAGVLGGLEVPSNGQVNPMDVTQALARGAKMRGGKIHENTNALRIDTHLGRVKGVETDKGYIQTEKVILAGGMWTQKFAKAHGVTVPLHAAEHVYLVTNPSISFLVICHVLLSGKNVSTSKKMQENFSLVLLRSTQSLGARKAFQAPLSSMNCLSIWSIWSQRLKDCFSACPCWNS